MKRSSDRILTTHVGSLIRPPDLQDFLRLKQAGKPYDEQAYQRCLTQSVAAVVRQQAETGVDVVSDGEFGKSISWSQYVLERLSGFERRPIKSEAANPFRRGADRARFAEFYTELDARDGIVTAVDAVCVSPIQYTGQAELQRDIDNFKAALGGVKVEEAFMPVAAPASVIPDRKNEYYKNDDDLMAAIAEAMRTEYKMIIDAGFLVQLDDARNAVTYDRMVPPASFDDYRRWLSRQVELINHAIAGLPAERIRYHVCWGSWPGPHVSDVPLKDIADLILKVKVGAYVIEGANPRHEHEWKVWQQAKLAARPGAHPRRHQPRHQCGGTPRTGGRAHRAPGETGRPRERDRRHRLRLRARAVPPPRPPHHHVGEAGIAGRRGPFGEPGTLVGLRGCLILTGKPVAVPDRPGDWLFRDHALGFPR